MSDLTTLQPGAGDTPATGADLTPEQAQARMTEICRDSGFKARYAAGDSAARREFAQLNAAIAAGMGEHPDEYSHSASRGASRPQQQTAAAVPAGSGAMTAAQALARLAEMKADKAFIAKFAAGDADARREFKQINEAMIAALGDEGNGEGGAEPPASDGPVDPASYKMPKLSDNIQAPGEIARVKEVDTFLRTTLSSLSVPKESGDQLLAAGERFGTTWNAADAAGRNRINVSEKTLMQKTWGDSFDQNITLVRETIEVADAINPGLKQMLWDTGLLNSSMVVSMILAHGQRMRGARA